jgi:hypothetical protein
MSTDATGRLHLPGSGWASSVLTAWGWRRRRPAKRGPAPADYPDRGRCPMKTGLSVVRQRPSAAMISHRLVIVSSCTARPREYLLGLRVEVVPGRWAARVDRHRNVPPFRDRTRREDHRQTAVGAGRSTVMPGVGHDVSHGCRSHRIYRMMFGAPTNRCRRERELRWPRIPASDLVSPLTFWCPPAAGSPRRWVSATCAA